MIEALVEKTSFAGGEISPMLYARQGLARNQTGLMRLENAVTMIEGGIARRPGTRFQLPLKTQSERGKQWTFRYTAGDTYVLVFNGGKMRVKRAGGYVLSGSDPYEISIPWAAADLPNLRAAQVGNVLFVVCAGYVPRAITRNDHDEWVLAEYQPKGGPVGDQNLEEGAAISTSALEGAITLASNVDIFTAAHVGGVFRLDESDLSLVPSWKANETVSIPLEIVPGTGATNFGDVSNPANAFDGNDATSATKNFSGASNGTGFIGRSYSTPTKIFKLRFLSYNLASFGARIYLYAKQGAAPTFRFDGTLLGTTLNNTSAFMEIVSSMPEVSWDHIWVAFAWTNAFSLGSINLGFFTLEFHRFSSGNAVLRRYQGNVYAAMSGTNTGPNPPVHTEGAVLSDSAGVTWRFLHNDHGYVRISSVTDGMNATGEVLTRLPNSVQASPTYRWFPPDWNSDAGFPDRIYLHDGRLLFARGNRFWLTRPSDLYSLEEIAGNPDSALSFALRSQDGSLPDIEWVLSAGGALVLGLRDGEWIGRTASLYEAITVENFIPRPKKNEGSTDHVPVPVEGGAIIIGRNKGRLHFVLFDDESSALDVKEITKAARHILKGKAAGIAWQRDPNKIGWIWCENGDLRGLTFDVEEKVLALHRHPMVNGFVEDIVSAPSADETVTEIHLIVRRVINGETKRYTEILADFFEPQDEDAPTAEGAWFVDCGLRYQGAPATTFQVPHLAGQEVAIHVDGAMRPRQTVPLDGEIVLPRAGADVLIGLPIAWKAKSLPFDLNTSAGSTKGDRKTAQYVVLDMVHAAGGYVRCNDGEKLPLHPTGGKKKGAPIDLKTGTYVVGPIACEAMSHVIVEVGGDDTMPFTLTGMSPDLDVLETG